MIFSSVIFIWLFLPLVIILYFITDRLTRKKDFHIKAKNILLMAVSLFFYIWSGPAYPFVLLGVILFNYAGGIVIRKYEKKSLTAFFITADLLFLCTFKYFNSVAHLTGSYMQLIMPIGISFYTFRAVSYIADVYSHKAEPLTNIVDVACYISFFPQLTAGPIERFADFEGQLKKREETADMVYEGIEQFTVGLAKKILIADILAQVADEIWATGSEGTAANIAWLGLLAYTLQIYYDFSGYSDMAIGLSRIFGFKPHKNFDLPYMSESVSEFWRRWHISLSSWFREYVYIPLGGSREGMMKTCRNLIIVFALTGIWHGADLTFLMWGLWYGLILVIERLWFSKILKKNPVKILNMIYTLLAVMFGWVLFRSDTLADALTYFKSMFGAFGIQDSADAYLSAMRIIVMIAGIFFMGPVQRMFESLYGRIKERTGFVYVRIAVMAFLIMLSIIVMVNRTYQPFIYYQF